MAEQIPGAMDAFVKAAREAFKDENIGTKELFKLMEDGKLLAKDILPLVGKHMSEAAKKGGALEKMLQGNMVAMNRLRQTWQNFQNAIFMGGFGEALTKWFNQLAAMLKDNTGLAKTFGAAIGAVMDQLLDKFTMVYDWLLYFWLNFEYYFIDRIPKALKDLAGDWLAQVASIVIVLKTFQGLYKIVKMLFGLGTLGKALGLGSAAKDATTIAGKLGGLLGAMTRLVGVMGILAPLLLKVFESSMANDKGIFDMSAILNPLKQPDYQGLNTLKSIVNPESMFLAPFRNQQPLQSSWAAAGQAGTSGPVKIEISTKDSEFGRVIDARIVDNDNKNINMLTGE